MAVRGNGWQAVRDELAHWRGGQRRARLWLRDDDAVEVTPALEAYAELANRFEVPFTLAVIPRPVGRSLADWAGRQAGCTIAVHGFAHVNHAPAGEKKCEVGLHRGRDVIVDELSAGRRKLADLFADHYIDMLVPPWNRIDPALVDDLAGIGFRYLSTYAGANTGREKLQPVVVNTHIDIIDWKGTRGGLPVSVLAEHLAGALRKARLNGFAGVGILTHHLVHDQQAEEFLMQLFEFVADQDEVFWVSASEAV